MITNNARCTCEIKSKIGMAKAAFDKKKTLFTSKLDLLVHFKRKLVNCHTWIMAVYGVKIGMPSKACY
jgi:hypothetical protein